VKIRRTRGYRRGKIKRSRKTRQTKEEKKNDVTMGDKMTAGERKLTKKEREKGKQKKKTRKQTSSLKPKGSEINMIKGRKKTAEATQTVREKKQDTVSGGYEESNEKKNPIEKWESKQKNDKGLRLPPLGHEWESNSELGGE